MSSLGREIGYQCPLVGSIAYLFICLIFTFLLSPRLEFLSGKIAADFIPQALHP